MSSEKLPTKKRYWRVRLYLSPLVIEQVMFEAKRQELRYTIVLSNVLSDYFLSRPRVLDEK